MTQTLNRSVPEQTSTSPPSVPPHPHYALGTLIALGILGTLAAVVVAIIALTVTAGRNSVDDAIVSERVDAYLAEAGAAVETGDVIPALVPKADLPVATEPAVAVAPQMPPPPQRATPAIVEVEFEIVEGVNVIDPASGVETETWGYRLVDGPDGVVAGTPGPVIRARVGDVLRFTVTNPEGNTHPHNVDFHAVTGPGGGAADTVVAPGETKTIEVRLLYPGFFMYHCAYDDVPAHISHGMFGGILVDPETPLPAVDHEWYIVQSEYYTSEPQDGVAAFDRRSVTDENPSYVVFNGAVDSLTGDNALQMQVGERARIYFINAGLNLNSNFHPIGSHWDKVYPEAALLATPIRGSQTTLVPAGGGTVVEMVGQVPSTIVLVDHALARAFDKGAIGQVVITGEANPEIYEAVGGEAADPNADHMGGGSEQPAAGGEQPAGGGEQVSIMPGSSEFQDLDSPNEFDDDETPADYSVNVLRVKVGTTVTWTNDDQMMHSVTSADGLFDSGLLDPGQSWSYTFDQPGEFEYFCSPHPWMRAKVIVEG
ncbi:MAG TPA: plastocyanin/azurin family copper-binding protein [Acidimicrobiia bacterium]|jgi:nitrite reductase (NO-forming)